MKKQLAGVTPGIKTNTVLQKTWEAIPGFILCFPVCIALSGKMSAEREQTIGASSEERAEMLLDFRVRLLGDVLEEPPRMLDLNKATELLTVKQDKAAADHLAKVCTSGEPSNAQKHFAESLRNETRLTEDELNGAYEYFPNWTELTEGAESLSEGARIYFGQKDVKGRVTFQILVEDIIAEYWAWATPRPTISVSAFLQNKQATSITS